MSKLLRSHNINEETQRQKDHCDRGSFPAEERRRQLPAPHVTKTPDSASATADACVDIMNSSNCENVVGLQKEAMRYSPVTSKDEAQLMQFGLVPEKTNKIWIEKVETRIFYTTTGFFELTHDGEAVRKLFGRDEGMSSMKEIQYDAWPVEERDYRELEE